MARILDIAQEVKALSSMLELNQFPFVIDLACWAAKREFLKLDKWVIDKLKEYQVCSWIPYVYSVFKHMSLLRYYTCSNKTGA